MKRSKFSSTGSVKLLSFVSDFQNMPNAMRPSAPRPQTFNTIRPTTTANTQVPRMMTSQRMRKYFSWDSQCACKSSVVLCSLDEASFPPSFLLSHSHSSSGSAPYWSLSRCCPSACHAPVQVCCWCAQPSAAHGLPATSHYAAGKLPFMVTVILEPSNDLNVVLFYRWLL